MRRCETKPAGGDGEGGGLKNSSKEGEGGCFSECVKSIIAEINE